MIFSSIDYLAKTTDILKEAFKFKKYKAMNNVCAVFVGICMSPFVLISFVLAAFLYVTGFMFKLIATPIENIHNLAHSEGAEVKHATQVVIYLISWPLIFFWYTVISLMLLQLALLYAIFSCITYIWSLGGFKFHLFASDSDEISIEAYGKYNIILPLAYLIVMAVLLILIPLIRMLIDCIDAQTFEYASEILTGYILQNLPITFAVSLLYSTIGFCPRP